MLREISSGGAVLRPSGGGWDLAVIEPQRDEPKTAAGGRSDKKRHKPVVALPKGLVDRAEKPQETALREVREETGLSATVLTKLTDIKYSYVRTWDNHQRVFKIVSFYLLRYASGTIDDISTEMRVEVKRAFWIPLAEAELSLTYRSEREVVRLARQYLQSHPEEAHE